MHFKAQRARTRPARRSAMRIIEPASTNNAVEELEKNIIAMNGGGRGEDFLLLAMSHWQLGDKDDAKLWFERDADWVKKQPHVPHRQKSLRNEAAELLGVNAAAFRASDTREVGPPSA